MSGNPSAPAGHTVAVVALVTAISVGSLVVIAATCLTVTSLLAIIANH